MVNDDKIRPSRHSLHDPDQTRTASEMVPSTSLSRELFAESYICFDDFARADRPGPPSLPERVVGFLAVVRLDLVPAGRASKRFKSG